MHELRVGMFVKRLTEGASTYPKGEIFKAIYCPILGRVGVADLFGVVESAGDTQREFTYTDFEVMPINKGGTVQVLEKAILKQKWYRGEPDRYLYARVYRIHQNNLINS